MKRPYQIASAVLILFAAFIARESVELTYYTPIGPGPGFFPFWISVIIAALAGIMLFHATFRPSDPMPADFFPSRAGYLRIAAITLALIGALLLMKPLGFRLTLFGFLLFLLFALGRQNIIVTALVSLAGSFGTFYLFETWLKVPLPVGMFGI